MKAARRCGTRFDEAGPGQGPHHCRSLARKLAADAWLYVESPLEAPSLPPEWALHREGRTRDVRYALYRRQEYPQERPSDQPRGTLEADSTADGASTA